MNISNNETSLAQHIIDHLEGFIGFELEATKEEMANNGIDYKGYQQGLEAIEEQINELKKSFKLL